MSLLDYDGLDYHTGKFKTWVKKLLEGKSNAGHKHTKSDITDFPKLGTASSKDIASNGNASASQVVMGNDTRLTDARKASDVYTWAKASTKPTYTASEVGAYTKTETDTKLNSKINTSLKGSANGLAELDSNGKVPSTQLPSFVDDVIEGYLSSGKFYKESAHTTQISGESGKIYIDLSTEKTYRWSGSAFVVISETLALGETSSTAYRGDRGKTAYDHSQSTHARIDATKVEKSSTNGNIKINGTETTVYTHPSGTNPHGTTKSDVGLGNVGNFKAVSTVSNQGLSDTEKSNARSNIGAQVAGSYASSTHTHDDRYYTESEIDSKLNGKANSSHTHTKSDITDFPTSMPANGGNSTTVNGHNINSDVPANAKFTDTVYDDTEVKESIEDLNSNLDGLKYSEIAGGKNLFDVSKIDLIDVEYRNGVYTNKTTDSKTFFDAYIDYWNDDGYMRGTPNELFSAYVKGRYRITGKIIEGCTKIRLKHNGATKDIVFFIAQISYFGLKVGDTFTISIDVNEYNPSNVGGLIVKNIQIEKGTQATEYEQYIPSVKMLTSDVAKINSDLNGKANSSHTHTKSDITDFPTSMPASDVYAWAKASSKPSYSWSEITNKPSTFTPASHTHSYLPLSGGTITGAIKTLGDGILNISTDRSTNFSGGTDLSNGATLILRGKDQNGLKGMFELATKISGAAYTLIGSASSRGTLSWDGYEFRTNGDIRLNSSNESSTYGLYNGNDNMICISYGNDIMYSSGSSRQTAVRGTCVGNGNKNTCIDAYQYLYLYSNMYISSNQSIATASDEKVKRFSDILTNDHDALIKIFDIINPKSYKYKYSMNNSESIGFSAQEVEKAFRDEDIDPTKYSILNIQYDYMISRGGDEEDYKYYTKFMEISYNDLYNLSILKIKDMEEKHVNKLNNLEKRLSALENKEVK